MMTNEKRKKIGTIGGFSLVVVCVINNATLRMIQINVGAVLALAVIALVTAAMYIRDNGPLPQRELMKEAALIILILVLLVFAGTSML